MLYTLQRKQKLPIPLQEAWDFIANPKNLAVITPPAMGFVTLSGDDRPMFAGQIIHYTITPVLGIKLQWVTEITHVADMQFFVDEQRYGPYAFWHHKHFLKEIPAELKWRTLYIIKYPWASSAGWRTLFW